MFISAVRHPYTAVKKTIVYSDTILNLKEMGSNIKFTTISDVGEYSLESCIKTILESNPNATFNTIQYSKKDKKVYFYTNPEVDTKAWDESNGFVYEPLKSNKEILSEVNRLLGEPVCKKGDCISLYDVAILMKSKYDELENSKEYYDKELDGLVKSELGAIHCCLYNFNYETNELTIGIKDFTSYNYEDIVFTKKDGDLIIVRSNYWNANEILECLGNLLSKVYDRMLEFKTFEEQSNYGFSASNSNFFVDISNFGVSISNEDFDGDFELSLWSFEDDYDYNCNSTNVINALRSKEDEIFKRIFVKIDDCPEWARTQLYLKRQDELTVYRIATKKAKEKEMKRVRRREIAKKIVPFLKDYKK